MHNIITSFALNITTGEASVGARTIKAFRLSTLTFAMLLFSCSINLCSCGLSGEVSRLASIPLISSATMSSAVTAAGRMFIKDENNNADIKINFFTA